MAKNDMMEKLKGMSGDPMLTGNPMIPTPVTATVENETPENPEDASEEVASMGLKESEQMIADKASSGDLSANSVQHSGDEIITLSKSDHPDIAEDTEGNKVVFVVGGTVKSVDGESVVVSVDEVSVVHGKPPIGTGERFNDLTGKLRKQGSENPEALAAWIGRKNMGASKFNELAAKGRRNH